ncbi:histidine kinase [Flavitalea sp. BT771]|uniref:histidine kinase n=1 Tax=Flavitalea sp. BT771 TaxID=3063329 RepID=UPI0026E239A7|nr:histidine kinase [Flavitalea sp. BT771]MDO6431104.1 histidine kinase [Flavitalea sp. BT771]MDV6220011.1 histidine kinase [Flavitalea sp. BT771]
MRLRLTGVLVRAGFFLCCLLSGKGLLMGQGVDGRNFIRYTQQDGLSHDVVTSVTQDSTGYIWMSTFFGVNRFDGSHFVQMNSCSDSASMQPDYLRGMIWLDRRRLAVYSDGLHIFDTYTGSIKSLFVPFTDRKYQYKYNEVHSVQSDASGNIFLLTYSGFYHFDKDYQLAFRYDHYAKDSVAGTTFAFGRKLMWLDAHRLLVVTIDGLFYYNIDKKEFRRLKTSDAPLLADFTHLPDPGYIYFQNRPGCFFIMNNHNDTLRYIDMAKNISTVTELSCHVARDEFGYRSVLLPVNDSTIYITAHTSGFYKIHFDPGTGDVDFYTDKYFPLYSCRNLFIDRDRNLWVATNKGLFRQGYSQCYVEQSPIPSKVQALYPNIVMDDVHVLGKNIYVATRGNGGLLVFDKETLQFIRRIGLEEYNSKRNGGIYCLTALSDTTLLVGLNGPLVRLNLLNDHVTPVKLDKWDALHDWIADIYKDRHGNIWVASGNIYRYDAASRKFSVMSVNGQPYSRIEEANIITEDHPGNIWIAGHGLTRYNSILKIFDKVVDTFPSIKMPDSRVNSFVADHDNHLWVNVYNNGLACYDFNKGFIRHFTRDNGLPDNNISAMILLGNKLWLATFSGIACLDIPTSRITSFGKEDGFPDLPINIGTKFYYDVAENMLYIGFATTLVRFNPDIVYRKEPPPHFFIEGIRAGDLREYIYPQKAVEARWNDNDIRVTIGCINFSSSNTQRFAYRILKNDSTLWQPLGAQNTFSISSLPPGDHRIQVKVFSAHNRWPEQVKEIWITILPPFWKQNWFTITWILLLALCVYLLLKWRIELTRKKEQAKTHIEKLKAEEYKSQYELEQISHYFSSSLADKKNVEGVLWDVAKNLIGRMNYVDCMIYLWNEDKSKMVQKASYGPKGSPKAIREKVFDVLPGQGVVGQVVLTREPLLIANTREDDRYRVDDIARLSEVCVPIIHNNELIGVIDSEHPEPDYYKERDIKILTTIATHVGNKIKQIESQQSLEIKQRELVSINQQLAEAQLSALQTQMNPHFIFNSLNSIKGMILDNEQKKASRYLSKFAQMIRITLNQSKETFTTLYENMEYLESYLMMEKLRFGDFFTFSIDVDDEIDKEDVLIPTMMIQPLAENAIWHGMMHKKGEMKLLVRFSMEGETISCTIQDNGIGIEESQRLKQIQKPTHQSVGLSNLRHRIKILNEKFDAGCSLEIKDLSHVPGNGTGTCVVLRFNTITNKPCV